MATLKFTSRTDNTQSFTDTGAQVNQDTDLDGNTVIGYDTTYVTTTATGATAEAALAIDGGFLFATFTTSDGQNWSGSVTGGTGKFKGAKGTVTATATSQTELAVTVDYSP